MLLNPSISDDIDKKIQNTRIVLISYSYFISTLYPGIFSEVILDIFRQIKKTPDISHADKSGALFNL